MLTESGQDSARVMGQGRVLFVQDVVYEVPYFGRQTSPLLSRLSVGHLHHIGTFSRIMLPVSALCVVLISLAQCFWARGLAASGDDDHL